jgi:hypothetical protein
MSKKRQLDQVRNQLELSMSYDPERDSLLIDPLFE